MMIKKKRKTMIDNASLRFPGGSKMIVGDKDIYYVCCALIAAYQGAEKIPQKKRVPFLVDCMSHWADLLQCEDEWMQKLEQFNREVL